MQYTVLLIAAVLVTVLVRAPVHPCFFLDMLNNSEFAHHYYHGQRPPATCPYSNSSSLAFTEVTSLQAGRELPHHLVV